MSWLSEGLSSIGEGFSSVGKSIFGERPEYKPPESFINASDLDRLIDLTREYGEERITRQLGEAQRSGTEFMASQGLAGTGGIPGQLWGNIQQSAFDAGAGLEQGLANTRINALMQLQNLAQRQSEFQYSADMQRYQANPMFDLLDVGGMAALSYFGG